MAATVISVVSPYMVTPSLKIEKPPDWKSGGCGCVKSTVWYRYQSDLISFTTSGTDLLLVFIFIVSSSEYIEILLMLLSMTSAVRIPWATSAANLPRRLGSSTVSDIVLTMQFVVSSSRKIPSIMDCSCITQQKITLSYAEQWIKLFSI